MAWDELSLNEARRVALAAQGFDRPRPRGRVSLRDLRRTIQHLGLIQIDYVNVLVPAHYQVLFSRLGPYEKSQLDDLVYRRREFTEQWAHEASIVPVEAWPLLDHRRKTHRVRPWGFEAILEKHPEYVARLLDEIRHRGPLSAGEMPELEGHARHLPSDWDWNTTVARAVLEAHFGRGLLAVADRRPDFARVYDLAERVIAPEYHGLEVEREDAQRQLLGQAARAHGIATADDLADYYRMPVREAKPRLDELVESGELQVVKVEGWRQPAYLHRDARLPAPIEAASLISPFDPLIWRRPRADRLFGFEYRVEIFVPKPRRRWGYYVLPFLLGDRLVARVDLKADRAGRRLLVLSSRIETHARPDEVADPLGAELMTMAGWLGLESVAVEPRGDLARPLAAVVKG